MLWSEARSALRVLGPFGAVAAQLALSGCFTPMYASLNGQLGSELQAIAVDPVPDQLGHFLTDALITDLNGTGSTPTPKYHLTVTPHERVQSALVDTVTKRAQAATVVIVVDYTLTPVGSDKPFAKGTVTSAATYNRSEQRFANIRAARDAEIRDAKTLADQIAVRVAADLATRGS